jgi:Domain of unknown function (DUF4184)
VPFTPSHAAAVLPFLRRAPLSASALVMGSLAPDFPFYVPRQPAWPTHTARGVLTVDVALGAAGWALWHGLLARPALAAAPRGVRARLDGRVQPGLRRRLRDGRAAARVVGGLVVGAATHVLWDEFTHAERWGTEHLGVLSQTWRGRPAHLWAQDASGIAGAAALAVALARWWRRTPADDRVRDTGSPAAWAAVAASGLVGGALGAAARPDLRSAAENAAFQGGAAATATAVLLALSWHARAAVDPAR